MIYPGTDVAFEVFVDCIVCNSIPCLCASQQKAHCGLDTCLICNPGSQDEAMAAQLALEELSNPQPIYTGIDSTEFGLACECGSEKVGSPYHSDYCPKGEKR